MTDEELAKFLATISGKKLTVEEAKEILRDTRENRKKLDQCIPPHTFVPEPVDPKRTWEQKYRCTKCQGVIKIQDYYWYEKGLLHGSMRK